jgi:Amt family ammonium transporter
MVPRLFGVGRVFLGIFIAMGRFYWLILIAMGGFCLAGEQGLIAQEADATQAETPPDAPPAAPPTIEDLQKAIADLQTEAAAATASVSEQTGWLWTCIAAFLVFFMQAGFALVEAGFTRAKNCVNIIMKNLLDFSVGSIAYWMVGFGLMFGVTTTGWYGTTDFFVDGLVDGKTSNWEYTFLIFQTVFAATAATIVSGAMAERTKFTSYLVYSVIITAIVYPVSGSWIWGNFYHLDAHGGGGWLQNKGFVDFAGSTAVHSVGGWAALAGAIVIGARVGKFHKDGSVTPIMGHSLPLAALGVFILWLGWFGFNPGSTTSMAGGNFARIAVITNLSAVAGVLTAMSTSWILFKKPDASFALNGALAGLVSITAGCNDVGPVSALVIGSIGGVLCVLSVLMFDRLRIDDPVGAISVHGVCGAWGTLAVGLFAEAIYANNSGLFFSGETKLLWAQLTGIVAIMVWAFGTSLLVFLALKYTIGLRVPEEEEIAGLDTTEHGMVAYPYSSVQD